MCFITPGTTSVPLTPARKYTIANNALRHAARGDARYQMTMPHIAITTD